MGSLIQQLQAYEKAHNRHDIEAVVAMCTQDVRVEIVGVWAKAGKDNVRLLEEWDAAVDGSLSLKDLVASDQEVHCRALEYNEWFRLAGIGEVEYSNCRFSFRQGLIAEIRSEMTTESEQAISAALRSVTSWASRERGKELARLMPGKEFVYGRESARVWLSLLREWRESQQEGET